jgi:hypothetical protein
MQNFLNNTIMTPLQNLLAQIYAFLPNIFAMIFILLVGLILGYGMKILLNLFLKLIRFDKLSMRIGFSNVLQKSGIRLKPSEFISKLVYWSLFFIFIMLAINALKVPALDALVAQFFLLFPNIVAGIILFFAGYLFSIVLARTVLIAAVNYQIKLANFISRAVQILVLLFFLAIALEQIGIGENIVVASFSITFGGIVLALALALGLGGRELGKQWLERHFDNVKSDEKNEKDMWSHV